MGTRSDVHAVAAQVKTSLKGASATSYVEIVGSSINKHALPAIQN